MTDVLRTAYKQIKEQRKYQEENKLLFIKPLPDEPPWPEMRLNRPQTRAMNTYTKNRKIPRRLITVGANKTTKSNFSIIRAICLSNGGHPFMPEDHPLYDTTGQIPVPNVGILMGETLTKSIERKIVPLLLEWIPAVCRPVTKKNAQGVITKITLTRDFNGNPLGSIIYLDSYNMEEFASEGIDFHWAGYDEPPPNNIYVTMERGLVAYSGISWMAFTSLKEPWIKDLADTSVDYGGPDETIRVLEFGDIWENRIDKGGFLTEQDIQDFIKIVPKEQYDARVLGKWMKGGERIFSSFLDEEPYVCPDFDAPKHWTFIEGLNPHDGKNTQWDFFAVSPHEINILGEVVNRVFCIDYILFPPDVSISEMVKDVKLKRIELGYDDPYMVVIDAKHGRRSQKPLSYRDEETWEEKLTEVDAGYIELADQRPGDISLGHKIVREYLKPQFYKLADAEIPGIVFLDRCHGEGGPIEGMLKYRFKKDSDKPEEDEFKDACDVPRYVLMKMPIYLERNYMGEDRQRITSKYTGR